MGFNITRLFCIIDGAYAFHSYQVRLYCHDIMKLAINEFPLGMDLHYESTLNMHRNFLRLRRLKCRKHRILSFHPSPLPFTCSSFLLDKLWHLTVLAVYLSYWL